MEQTKIVYDPNKNYKWEPQQTVDITGQDFDNIQRFVFSYMNNTPQLPYIAVNALQTIKKILEEQVEEGNFTEIVPEPEINSRTAKEEAHSEYQMD